MVRLSLVLQTIKEWGEQIGETVRNNLVPSWVSFVMQLAAFIILLVIVFFIGYKPLKKMMKARQDYIEKEISDAEKSKAEAENNLMQSEEAILASKKQASEIISDAQLEAKKQQEVILLNASKEVEKMKKMAEEDIQKSRQEALDEIHKQIVEVALLTSSEILKREVNNKDNARLAEEFIEKL